MDRKLVNLHPKLERCNQCKSYNISLVHDDIFKGCDKVICLTCSNCWHVCQKHLCRFSNQNIDRLNQHFFQKHNSTDRYVSTKRNDQIDINDQYSAAIETHYESCDDSLSIQSNKKQKFSALDLPRNLDLTKKWIGSMSTQCKIFFSKEFSNPGNGLCKLISDAFAQNSGSDLDPSITETNFHLDAAHFCLSLTEAQKEQFIGILRKVISTNFKSTRIPLSDNDIHRFYTTNKYSLCQNMQIGRAHV